MPDPLISICIPSFKRVDQLNRLLLSISSQTFKDFEVIITDDSPDDSVKQLCESYYEKIPLRYYKNSPALGTPENWNEGIRKATGQWIKLMHDDDWFLSNDSLAEFARATVNGGEILIFSAYKNIKDRTEDGESVFLSPLRRYLLNSNPVSILSKNCIGPPSVTLFEREPLMDFDNKLKWLVDMEFYIRQLKSRQILYLYKPLIGIGISDSQVTSSSSLNPKVEIPEHLYLLNKLGVGVLNNIPFYDAYWRLFRNLRITDIDSVKSFASDNLIPQKLIKLISFQNAMPNYLFRNGLLSKFFMLISYCKTRFF